MDIPKCYKMNKNDLTVEEEQIFMSIIPDFLDTIESRNQDFLTLKEKADAWYKIVVLYRLRTGQVRSVRNLRGKYFKIRSKLLKAVGYKLREESPCNQNLQSKEVDLGNDVGGDHSGYLKICEPELISVEEDSLLPMETEPGTVEEKDPLELPSDIATDKTTENDPLRLPMDTEQVDPLDISLVQDCSEKINFLCNKKVDSFINKSSLKNKKIKKSDLAKDKSCQPTNKKAANKKIELQKRMLEVEDPRNVRKKMMIQIEEERNERQKIMLRIEEERNEREKIMLRIEEERNEREKIMLRIEEEKNEQEKRMLCIEEEKNEREKRMLCIEEEKNEREKRLFQLKEGRNDQNEKILQLETKIIEQNRIMLQIEAERKEREKRFILIKNLKKF